MLWTLVAFLAILAAVILQVLKKVIKTITEKYLVYPSDAKIDQELPEEILEHVMTFVDPRALIECRLVSKYWRYHAKKPRVEKEVISAYDHNVKISLFEHFRKIDVTVPILAILPESVNKSRTVLWDRALAGKHGKTLLDSTSLNFPEILPAFSGHTDANKYMAHVYAFKDTNRRGTMYFQFSDHKYHKICFKEDSVPGHESGSGGTYASLMFDLADYFDATKKERGEQTVYSIRERFPTPYFGFVPLNIQFLVVLAILFAPLIVHDVLNSGAFLTSVKTWMGPLGFLATCVLNFIVIKQFGPSRPFMEYPVFYGASTLFWIFYVLATFLAFPFAMKYFTSIAISAALLLYLIILREYTYPWDEKKDLRRAMPAILATVLIFTMNDWRLTVDSVKNGVIWWQLFENTVYYALFCLHGILLNCLAKIGDRHRWEWRYLVLWDSPIVETMRGCFCFVIFLTLYAPTFYLE